MARKVNSKFLLILVLVVGGLGMLVAGFVYYRHKRHNPKQFLAIAEKAEQDGDYPQAGQNYVTAASMLRDPALMVKASDMYNQAVYDDVDNLTKSQQCLDMAVSTDPGCMPALERQLQFWKEIFRLNHNNPSPRLYDNLKDVSQKILKINPKHIAAREAVPIAAIDSWIHHFENDQSVIDGAVKQLVELQPDDPDNADIPFYISAAYATEAVAADRDGKPIVAAKLHEQSIAVIQQAVKGHDLIAAFHNRAARIYVNEPVLVSEHDKLELKQDRTWIECRKASMLVKPDDPDYDEIKAAAATYAIDAVGGQAIRIQRFLVSSIIGCDVIDSIVPEKVYREVIKEKPSDLIARLKLAEILGSRQETHDEAIDLLKTLPPPSPAERVGPRAEERKNNLELQALVSLTNLRLDKVMALSSKSEQDVLLPQIQADYRKLNAKAPDSPLVLRIKAKLQMVQGQITDAIATLDPAIAKTTDRDPMHFELMFLSAKCYLATNQSGSAKKYLQQIVDNYPSHVPARMLLAQTQLRENDYDNAEKNIEALKQMDPDNMEVVRMEIAVLLQQNKTDEAKKIYEKLPEQTRNQRLGKATAAMVLKMPDEDKRLIDSVLSADPGDVQAALMMSELDAQAKDTTSAMAVLDRALKVKPDNTDLMLQRAKLSGSSPDQMRQIRLREAQKISDPLERELALMDLTRDEPDENIPLQHLQAAEKLNPKDSRVLTALFEYNLGRRSWDQAKTYADRLAQINADKVNGTLFYWRLAITQAQVEPDPDKQRTLLARALDLATQLTHDYPEFAQTWLCMGQTLVALGRFEDAIPNFANARDKQPQNPEAYQGMINCYYQLKRPDDASTAITTAIKALPNVPVFKEMQIQHEMAYGNPEKVVADREQSVKNNPDSPQALMALAQVYAKVAQSKEARTETQGQANAWREKAKAALAQGADKFPDYLDFTINYASMCEFLNQPQEGEKLWKTTLSKAPWKDKPIAIGYFSDFYVRTRQPDNAEKVLRDYLASTGKGDVDITLKLVDLLAEQNKQVEALALVDSIPDNFKLQIRKIDLLITQNKLNEAEKVIQDLLQKNKTPQLTAALAYVYLNSNRAPQAIDLLNGVLNDNPDMSNARYYRAMAMLKLPNPNLSDVVNDLTRVRDGSPNNLPARYMLADCDRRLNNMDDAARELEGILSISPGQKTARLKLLDIYSQSSPPRWLDAQRIAREGEAQPELSGDADFLAAEAQMYSQHGEADRAVRAITQAMKVVPNNPTLIRIYYNVLLHGNLGQQLIADSDKLPKELKDAWWVHSMRGAAKCKMGDRDGGIAEFVEGINIAFAAKDEPAAQTVIDDMATNAGAERALKVVNKLSQASEPRWLFTIAWLQSRNKDIPAARKTLEQLLTNMDKLSNEQQAMALDFGGSLYLQTPDPDLARSRDLYLQLLKLRPNSFEVYNNLACNSSVSASDALDYGKRAYDLMQQAHSFQPRVADTYGWSLVQTNDSRNIDMGINVLLDAWKADEIPDTAYHLGKAYLAKGNAIEAQKYLDKAQDLYSEALKNDQVFDVTLQQSILDAQGQLKKLKGNVR